MVPNNILFVAILSFPEFVWYSLCHTERGATTIATYKTDFYAGEPAITVNNYGKGSAYYIGTFLNPTGLEELLTQIAESAGVTTLLASIPGANTEVVQRKTEAGEVQTYVLNHSDKPIKVELVDKSPKVDLLTGEPVSGELELAGYGVAILQPE